MKNEPLGGLKVVLITQGLSRVFFPLIRSKHKIVGVIEAAPRKKKVKVRGAFIVFLQVIYNWLRRAFFREKTLHDYCQGNDIPYFFLDKETESCIDPWLESVKPDIIVVYSMSQLLKEKIFNWPKYGSINLHPSYLPDYRGPNPDFWYYYFTDLNPGATVHYIDKGEDTGDIIAQEKFKIELGVKSPERLDKLIGEIGVKLLLESLNHIEAGCAKRTPQTIQSPTIRARNLKPEEHETIIDWVNWPIERIWHLLRGTELWLNALPSPRGIWSHQKWTIEEMIKCDTNGFNKGKIYKFGSHYFVFCRDGKIRLSIKFSLKNFVKSILKL